MGRLAVGLSGSKMLALITASAITPASVLSPGVIEALSLAADHLQFPATPVPSADPNAQDDYKEGFWTPVMRGSTGTAGAWATAGGGGTYIKVGRVVHCQMSQYLTNKGSYTGRFEVHGLPFVNGDACSGAIGLYPSTVVDAVARTIYVMDAASYMTFGSGSRFDVSAPYSEIVTGYYLMCSFSYFTT